MAATPANAEALRHAFEVFNRHTDRLEETYRELQEKVESLTRQLAGAQSARLKELVKKERLSRRLADLLESLPGAIIVLDRKGLVRQCNSEAVLLFKKPLIGCSWAAIVRRAVRCAGSEDGNLKLHDGRWLSLSRRPMTDGNGDVLLLSDITESRHVSALRERQVRLSCIGEMTARFAHEVRTPLAAAMLYAEQLDARSEKQAKIVRRISARLTDIGRMVNDMLGFAAGARTTDEIVCVAGLFNSVRTAIEAQLRPGTRLTTTVSDDGLRLPGNPDALKGALLNLLANAEQASGDDAKIALSAERVGEQVLVHVCDNGSGISDEIRPRIFEPFFTTRPQGTGLGLAVVRAVVTAHGGGISVASSERGATFTISLPALERTTADASSD